ncbi:MAG: 5-formyltetrahydrofolate cyclo-ligase [bacterium]
MDKKQLRNIKKKQRDLLDKNLVVNNSKKIIDIILGLDLFKKSKYVLSYMPFRNEVDVSLLMNKVSADKKIVLPKIIDDDIILKEFDNDLRNLKKNKYGILEPENGTEINPKRIEIAIIPGIVFDKKANRIGFGKGYYDRVLKAMDCLKLGVCYDFQLVDDFSDVVLEHDIKMDMVITEKEVLDIRKI